MGNSITKLLFGVLLTIVIFLCSGCRTDKNVEKREKLYSHARYQLKGELEQKDKEIAELTDQITDLKGQLAKQAKLADDCATKQSNEFMTMIDPIINELNQAKAENEQLKKELQKLRDNKVE